MAISLSSCASLAVVDPQVDDGTAAFAAACVGVLAAERAYVEREGGIFSVDQHRALSEWMFQASRRRNLFDHEIDAPEMPGHCRRGRDCVSGDPFASKSNLERMIAGEPVRCVQTDIDHYDRIVALCSVNGRDLSCAQVGNGFAINRYGALECPAG